MRHAFLVEVEHDQLFEKQNLGPNGEVFRNCSRRNRDGNGSSSEFHTRREVLYRQGIYYIVKKCKLSKASKIANR